MDGIVAIVGYDVEMLVLRLIGAEIM